MEGIESDAALISAALRDSGQVHVGRFDDRFQPGHRYQLVLMLDVLEHLEDPRAALEHALRLLQPGGTILITVPAFRLLWTQHDDMNRHYTRYTRRTFGQLACEVGLQLDECRYFYHWLFPLKLAVRLMEAVRRGEPRPPQVPASAVNRLCYAISRGEQRLCGRFPLPWGSSLLAVGRASSAAAARCGNAVDRRNCLNAQDGTRAAVGPVPAGAAPGRYLSR